MAKAWEVNHLDPDDAFGIGVKRMLRTRVREVFSYAPSVADNKSEEAVHDMRVAARRLKSVVSIFSDRFKKRQLKKYENTVRTLIQALGEVRDTDIFILRMCTVQQTNGRADDRALAYVLRHEIRCRSRSERRLVRVLKQLRANTFARDFRRFLASAAIVPGMQETSFRESGRTIVTRLLGSFLMHRQNVLTHPRALARLHAMRIAGKHVRYGMECFIPAYGSAYERCLEEVKALLDIMGLVHDCDVSIPRLAAWEQRLRKKKPHIPRQCLTDSIREIRDRRAAVFREMKETLERWERERFASTLERAMHAAAPHPRDAR